MVTKKRWHFFRRTERGAEYSISVYQQKDVIWDKTSGFGLVSFGNFNL